MLKQMDNKVKYALVGVGFIVILIVASQFMLPAQQYIIDQRPEGFRNYSVDFLTPSPVVEIDLKATGDETHNIGISILVKTYADTPVGWINVYFDDILVKQYDSVPEGTLDVPYDFPIEFSQLVTSGGINDEAYFSLDTASEGDDWYEGHRIIVFVYSPEGTEGSLQYEFRVKYTYFDGYLPPAEVAAPIPVDAIEGEVAPEPAAAAVAGIPTEMIIVGVVGVGALIGLFILNTMRPAKTKSKKK